MYYIDKLKAPAPGSKKKNWKGKGGVISQIMKGLGVLAGSQKTVERVITRVREAAKRKGEFTGEIKKGSGGHNVLLLPGSEEAQLIADTMEDGGSLKIYKWALNCIRYFPYAYHVKLSLPRLPGSADISSKIR